MHKVNLKSMHALVVRCAACGAEHVVSNNRGKAPTAVAFNHPQQKFSTKCAGCSKDVDWTPQDTKQVRLEAEGASA